MSWVCDWDIDDCTNLLPRIQRPAWGSVCLGLGEWGMWVLGFRFGEGSGFMRVWGFRVPGLERVWGLGLGGSCKGYRKGCHNEGLWRFRVPFRDTRRATKGVYPGFGVRVVLKFEV